MNNPCEQEGVGGSLSAANSTDHPMTRVVMTSGLAHDNAGMNQPAGRGMSLVGSNLLEEENTEDAGHFRLETSTPLNRDTIHTYKIGHHIWDIEYNIFHDEPRGM